MSNDGFSLDELLAIGTRKTGLSDDFKNMSATDINRSIPFAVSKLAEASASGFSEEQLKNIAERKQMGPAIRPSHINQMPVENSNPVFENILNGLQNILGIRTK